MSTESPASTADPDPAAFVDLMPFAAALGVRIEVASAEEVRAVLNWAPEKCTAGGILHGGALMAFADSAGAVCAVLNLPAGASTTTVASATNFFRGVGSGTVRAVARPLHAGRSVVVVQTDLTDADGRRVAQVTQTQAVLRPSAG